MKLLVLDKHITILDIKDGLSFLCPTFCNVLQDVWDEGLISELCTTKVITESQNCNYLFSSMVPFLVGKMMIY